MKYYSLSYLKGLSKSELGTLGENIVLDLLQKYGFEVINANTIHNNYKSIDLVCTNPNNHQSVGIQVKTSFDHNIPIGISLGNCVREELEKKIIGPWVFIHIEKDGSLRFFVLSREEMISLAHESNDWYINKWKPTFRKETVKLTNACGLCIKWLEGKGDEENDKHFAFINPLKDTTEKRWDKIADVLNSDCLYKTLSTFSGVSDITDENKKFDELANQFAKIANRIFFGGYFMVNNNRKIYPDEIEFYYHEEDKDGLKDPVMYHTIDHEKKDISYFSLGSLNFHVSGLDVTFENQQKKYRASFLIRGYKVFDFDGKLWIETKRHESRSTYIYEDMLMNNPIYDGLKIQWIDEQISSEMWKIVISCRKNVAAYDVDGNGKYIKDNEGNYIKEEISNDVYEQLTQIEQKKYFTYSGKKYKRCSRMWNYRKD